MRLATAPRRQSLAGRSKYRRSKAGSACCACPFSVVQGSKARAAAGADGCRSRSPCTWRCTSRNVAGSVSALSAAGTFVRRGMSQGERSAAISACLMISGLNLTYWPLGRRRGRAQEYADASQSAHKEFSETMLPKIEIWSMKRGQLRRMDHHLLGQPATLISCSLVLSWSACSLVGLTVRALGSPLHQSRQAPRSMMQPGSFEESKLLYERSLEITSGAGAR